MSDTNSIGIAYRDQAIDGGAITNSSVAATTLTSTGTTSLGANASALVTFHGATGVAQSAFQATALTTGVATGLIGFATTAQLQAAVDAINACVTCLRDKGLMAKS